MTKIFAKVAATGCVLLMIAAAVHIAGAQGGKGGKTAFEVRAELGDFALIPGARLVTGDTGWNDPDDHCEGALVPENNRGFFTSLRRCMNELTLPGRDGVLNTRDDVILNRGSFSAFQDRNSGDVVGIRLFFLDLNDNQYETDVVPVSPPSPINRTSWFVIHVHADGIEVRPQGGGNKPVVGHVSAGDMVYTPK